MFAQVTDLTRCSDSYSMAVTLYLFQFSNFRRKDFFPMLEICFLSALSADFFPLNCMPHEFFFLFSMLQEFFFLILQTKLPIKNQMVRSQVEQLTPRSLHAF